ncbi:S-adenosyl-L-methionine-dependent methyltransferase protein [Dioscorea alata]|uniref:S-adenosyl-L-methionine-dependent methyltransferase protein n=1 Tax=Dioscorea alata TaxID=55571 RepID=A0ACB7UPB3_DIOAL|nr:S-adenosyl-L-methionine-dependent methyltransferase protein [Dioscorea alata]
MDRHIQRLLNRISLAFAVAGTLALFHVFFSTSVSCSYSGHNLHHHDTLTQTIAHSPFPRSSCDAASRPTLPPDRRFSRIQSSRSWRRGVAALSSLFLRLRTAHLLSNSSRILCVSSGAGHEVAALRESGVMDVTGVDLIDFPPLVSRADPHNLPFFDNVFDLGFSRGLSGALFPARFVGELERTVRNGGAVALVVERCGSEEEVASVKGLFRKSSLVEVSNITLSDSQMTLIVMRVNEMPP